MKKLIYSATTANKSAFPLFHPSRRPAFRRRNQRQQHDHRAVPHERGQAGLIQRKFHADQPRRAQEQRANRPPALCEGQRTRRTAALGKQNCQQRQRTQELLHPHEAPLHALRQQALAHDLRQRQIKRCAQEKLTIASAGLAG